MNFLLAQLLKMYDNVLFYYYSYLSDLIFYQNKENNDSITYNLKYDRLILSKNNNNISVDRKINCSISHLFNNLTDDLVNKNISPLMDCILITYDNKEYNITKEVNNIYNIRHNANINENIKILDIIPSKYLDLNIEYIILTNEIFDEHKISFILNYNDKIEKYIF